MAVITSIKPADQVGAFAVVPTTLTGTDSLTYNASKKQVLYLQNGVVGVVNVVIDGDGVTTHTCDGQGAATDNSAGYTINLTAGQTKAVLLGKIRNFLIGSVAVTGGTSDVKAWIEEG